MQEFGIVHINNKRTIVIYLSNLTRVPAKWKINNIKAISKKKIEL